MTGSRRLVWAMVLALVLGAGGRALGQNADTLSLGIRDAIRLALEQNLDLKIERYEPLVARELTRQSSGEFDPLLKLSGIWSRSEVLINSALEQQAESGLIVDQRFTPDLSLTGRLITGTQYGVSLVAPTVTTNDPNRIFDQFYRPVLTFTLAQPLLRDFGVEINLVRFKQAERSELIASLGVEARMLTVMRDVETSYRTLFLTQEHMRVAEGSVSLAVDLVERLRRLFSAGRATALDVRQAEAAAEARRSDLKRAEADVVNARAQLQLLISPHPTRAPRLIAAEAPPEDGVPDGLEGKIARALARRPELRRQELVIENLRSEELLARNNTLPRLDVLGGVGWNGLGGNGVGPNIRGTLPSRIQGNDNYLSAFDDFLSPGGNVSWSLGLRLQMPLGNNDAIGRLEQARLRRDQERLRLTLLRNQISVDVQTAFADMSAAWAQIVATDEILRLAREQLEAQERQFRAGLATVRQVLEAQDAVAQAEDRRLQALVLYNAASSRLAAAEAATFETYRLVIRK